jgi:hypothetical protein
VGAAETETEAAADPLAAPLTVAVTVIDPPEEPASST